MFHNICKNDSGAAWLAGPAKQHDQSAVITLADCTRPSCTNTVGGLETSQRPPMITQASGPPENQLQAGHIDLQDTWHFHTHLPQLPNHSWEYYAQSPFFLHDVTAQTDHQESICRLRLPLPRSFCLEFSKQLHCRQWFIGQSNLGWRLSYSAKHLLRVSLHNAASRFLWRRRLSACVRVRGAHFQHKFWQF